jgi:hypothetical protein
MISIQISNKQVLSRGRRPSNLSLKGVNDRSVIRIAERDVYQNASRLTLSIILSIQPTTRLLLCLYDNMTLNC